MTTTEPVQLESRLQANSECLPGTAVVNGMLHCQQDKRNELLDVELPQITKGGLTYSPWAVVHEEFKQHFPYIVIATEYTATDWGTKIEFTFTDGRYFSEVFLHPCLRYKHPSYNHVDAPNLKDLTTAAQRGRVKAIALWCGLGMSAFLGDTSDIDDKVETVKDDIELPPVGNTRTSKKANKMGSLAGDFDDDNESPRPLPGDSSLTAPADFFDDLDLG